MFGGRQLIGDLLALESTAAWVFWLAAGVFVYALVGYAGLMWLVGRLSRRKGEEESWDDSDRPTVTLIVPAHNEEAVLERKIENALALDYPREKLEIVIASDGSTDRTVAIGRSYENQGVQVLEFERRLGKTAVLNDASEAATSEVLCLCDANVMFRHDALGRLVARLQNPRVGAVSGDVRLASEESSFGQGESAYYSLERTVQTGESIVGSMMGVDGGMYVIRKDLFEPLPSDTIVDDFVYAMRVIRRGRRVVLEPSAIATENGTPEATQEFARRVRLSAGAVQALKRGDFPPVTRPVEFWQFVSHKLLRWLGPVWLVVLLVSNALLWNAGVFYRVMLGTQAAFYGLALAATFSLPLRRTRIGGIVFYFVMSHVAMAVGLVKGLFNRQRVTWNRTERSAAVRDAEPKAEPKAVG